MFAGTIGYHILSQIFLEHRMFYILQSGSAMSSVLITKKIKINIILIAHQNTSVCQPERTKESIILNQCIHSLSKSCGLLCTESWLARGHIDYFGNQEIKRNETCRTVSPLVAVIRFP